MMENEDFVLVERHGDGESELSDDSIPEVSPEDLENIRLWLCPTHFENEGSEYQKHSQAHAPFTGDWLLQTEQYKKWHESENGALWIQGIPGSGKSVASANLIRSLKKEDVPVLFFFSRRIIKSNSKPQYLVRDALFQFLDHSVALQARMKKLMEENTSIENVPFLSLWKALISAITISPKVYLVFDALDELAVEEDEFLECLLELARKYSKCAKLLLTSRPLAHLQKALNCPYISMLRLSGRMIEQDIATYITYRMATEQGWNLAAEDKSALKDVLCQKGQGLFLYARLMLDEILYRTISVQDLLQQLPSSLEEMYVDLLHEHSTRSGASREFQSFILSRVIHASRPLRVTELAALVNSHEVRAGLEASQDAKLMVRTSCGPLLEILENETVQVIHHSFTEFLLDLSRNSAQTTTEGQKWFPAFTPADIHRSFALSCIGYLLSGCFDSWLVEAVPRYQEDLPSRMPEGQQKLMVRFHFLQYASQNLLYHASNCDSSDNYLLSQYDRFFRHEAHAFESWKDFLFSQKEKNIVKPLNFFPIHVAAKAGLAAYVAHLFETGEPPDRVDSNLRTAMTYAAMDGHANVLTILQEQGCSNKLPDVDGLLPIHHAAKGNHVQALRCLLDAGEDALSPKTTEDKGYNQWTHSTIGKTPLEYACELGNLAAVLELLDRLLPASKAKILPHWASATGQAKVLSHLLQHQEILENINQKDARGNTALYLAARVRDSATVEVLLKHGADVHSRSDDLVNGLDCADDGANPPRFEAANGQTGHTPLQGWASHRPSRGYHFENLEEWEKVGILLLEAGSDVEVRDDEGKTVIFAWTSQPRFGGPDRVSKFVSLLLTHGANPSATDNDGNTPLHQVMGQDLGSKILKQFIRAGADLNNARVGDLATPLIAAAKAQCCSAAKHFAEAGADFGLQDIDGNTALHWISKSWCLEYDHIKDWMKFADPSIRNNKGETCLYNMRFGNNGVGRVDAIPLLVEKGLSLESHCRLGRTALLSACCHGEPRFITGLIKYGADARSKDFEGKTCSDAGLHMVAGVQMSNIDDGPRDIEVTMDIMRQLIEAGADMSEADFAGNTPFMDAAASSGHFASTKIRLDAILELGGTVNTSNNNGQTALHKVAGLRDLDPAHFSRQGSPERIDYLLEPKIGLDLHARDNQGKMAIHYAASTSETNAWKLIQAGAHFRAQSNDGRTPLHFAAETAQSNVVGLICKLYGDNSWPIDQKDEKGRTALHYAAGSGISESVYYLLRAGAGPNIKDRNGLTPLHVAAEHRLDIASIRKNHKNEERLYWRTTSSGMTKLAPYMKGRKRGARQLATEQHDLSLAICHEEESCMIQDVARQLIFAGADPTIHDRDGQTAYDVAVLMNNECLATELAHHRQAKDLQNPLATVWHTFRHTNVEDLVGNIDIEIADNYLLMETAVSMKNEALFEALIKSGGSFQVQGPDGLTPVHTVAHRGLISMMKIVAKHLDNLDVFSPPLLHVASSRDQSNLQMVDLLIELGVDVNAIYREAKDAQMRSTGAPIPSYAAAHIFAMGEQWWNITALDSLCKAGADMELTDAEGNTVLQCALNGSKCGSWGPGFWRNETLGVLLKHGANINTISPDNGLTPLMAALESSRGHEIIQGLLDAGADINLGKVPAIFPAIETEDVKVVAAILAAGADPNTQYRPTTPRNYGRGPKVETPLLAATLNNGFSMRDFRTRVPKKEIITLLLEHGANPLAKLEDGDDTVLHRVAYYHGFIAPILKFGVDIESQDVSGQTPLLVACNPMEDLYRALEDESTPCDLIHFGADFTVTDAAGSTPLLLAAKNGLTKTVRLLLEKGASPLAKNNEAHTPLYYAISHPYYLKKLTMTKALLDAGADPLFISPNKETALHMLAPLLMQLSPASCAGTQDLHASGNGGKSNYMTEFTTIFQAFIDAGCDCNARDGAGNTPLFHYVKEVKGRCPDYFTIGRPAPEDIKKMFDENDVTAVNDKGDTLLHVVAARQESEESERDGDGIWLFEELMRRGLDPRAENNEGVSALDIAAACGNTAILDLFKREE